LPHPNQKKITIPISAFTNDKGQPVVVSSIKRLVFTVSGDNQQFSDFSLKVKNVYFNNNKPSAQLGSKASAYPNPFSRYTTLTFPAQVTAGVLTITDNRGAIIRRLEITVTNGEYLLDAINIQKGNYFFTMQATQGNKYSGKLVVR
jgi:hypothetical protein